MDEKDEDLQLCPRLIEKLVVPRVTFLLANCYNPFSAKQTERAVTLFRQFIEEPLPLLKVKKREEKRERRKNRREERKRRTENKNEK